jgi:hypothetical protein
MRYVTLTLVTAALLCISAIAQDSQSVSQAQTASSAWLALVDAGFCSLDPLGLKSWLFCTRKDGDDDALRRGLSLRRIAI